LAMPEKFNVAAVLWPRKDCSDRIQWSRGIGWLQCGRGLMTAERSRRKRGMTTPRPLQCGRGLMTAESCAKFQAENAADIALQCGRGLMTAERIVSPVRCSAWHLLQCGRGLMTAESKWSATPPLRTWPLQCGRGLMTAERIAPGAARTVTSTCFNVAAVLWPRKGRGHFMNTYDGEASMWPRSYDRGKASDTVGAFTRHNTLQCGRGLMTAESQRRFRRRPLWGCFNVAAVLWPRKVSVDGTFYQAGTELQCGRGLMTAERSTAAAASPASWSLQCGRGLMTAESAVHGQWPAWLARFNVAAVLWPRKGRYGQREVAGRRGFNVAAVLWPRKGGRSTTSTASQTSFNVAAVLWPRKAAATNAPTAQTARFNVAAVLWPRKGAWRPLRSSACPRFNVAAVLWPRKVLRVISSQQLCWASMWPRSYDRGKLPETWQT